MTATIAGATGAPDRIELVDEDDARSALAPLFEQVPDAARADTDKHLDKIGTRHMEEWHIGLAGHGLGQQGLARAGHADQQDTLGYACAHLHKFLRVLQVVDDFEQLVLRFLLASHIGEGRLFVVFHIALRAALAETEGLVVALALPHHHPNQEEGEEPREQLAEYAQRADVGGGAFYLHIMGLERLQQLWIGIGYQCREFLDYTRLALERSLNGRLIDNADRGDVSLIEVRHECRVRYARFGRGSVKHEESD